MAPGVELIFCATPPLPWPAWLSGQVMVSPWPRVHAVGAAAVRYLVKLLVVPGASARCTMTMASDGSVVPGLSVAMAGAFHVLILPPKMPASVSGLSLRVLMPDSLYETVMGADTSGKYNEAPPFM